MRDEDYDEDEPHGHHRYDEVPEGLAELGRRLRERGYKGGTVRPGDLAKPVRVLETDERPRETDQAGGPVINRGAEVDERDSQMYGANLTFPTGAPAPVTDSVHEILAFSVNAAIVWQVGISFYPLPGGSISAGEVTMEFSVDRDIQRVVFPVIAGTSTLHISRAFAFQSFRIFYVAGAGPMNDGFRIAVGCAPYPGGMK